MLYVKYCSLYLHYEYSVLYRRQIKILFYWFFKSCYSVVLGPLLLNTFIIYQIFTPSYKVIYTTQQYRTLSSDTKINLPHQKSSLFVRRHHHSFTFTFYLHLHYDTSKKFEVRNTNAAAVAKNIYIYLEHLSKIYGCNKSLTFVMFQKKILTVLE